MNKKNMLKIFLDIIMTVIFLMLMSINITGMNLHEILGLGILALFIIHNILNWAFTKNISKRILQKGLKTRVKVMFYLAMALLIDMIIMAVSGILISKTILTSIAAKNTEFWTNIHVSSAYLGLVLISIHVGMHWNSIMGAFRKMFRINGKNLARKVVLTIMSVMMIINGLITIVRDDILKKILQPLFGSDNSINNSYNHNTYSNNSNGKHQPFNKGNSENGSRNYGSIESQNNINTDNSTIKVAEMSFSNNETARRGGNYNNRAEYDLGDSNNSIDINDEGLQQYLGSLNCTACGKHCPLTSPQCGRGMQQAQQAIQEYSNNSSSETQDNENNNNINGSDNNGNSNITDGNNNGSINGNNGRNENNSNSIIDESNDEGLQQYLGALNCTGCGRNCPLTNPQCNKGVQQAQQAIQQYNSKSSAGNTVTGVREASDFTNVINLISVMSVFIAGTHFIIKFNDSVVKNKSSNKK